MSSFVEQINEAVAKALPVEDIVVLTTSSGNEQKVTFVFESTAFIVTNRVTEAEGETPALNRLTLDVTKGGPILMNLVFENTSENVTKIATVIRSRCMKSLIRRDTLFTLSKINSHLEKISSSLPGRQ